MFKKFISEVRQLYEEGEGISNVTGSGVSTDQPVVRTNRYKKRNEKESKDNKDSYMKLMRRQGKT